MEKNKENCIKDLLNQNIDQLNDYKTIVNNGKPFFEKEDYKIVEDLPIYFEPDELGRARGAIAIISRNTLSIRTEKHLRYPNPNGWTNKIEVSGIFQRCHAIAYRLSAKRNQKNNMFIGTIDLNKTIMNDIEGDIEKYIRENEKLYIRILYRVAPQYKGKNQIPTGVLIEANGIDTEYNVCVFCYNVEDKVKFNYADGTIFKDNRIIGKNKLFGNAQKSYANHMQKKSENNNINIVLDSKSKIYHNENCILPSKIEPKYIREITTKGQVIEDEGYTKCKKCFNKNK